MLLREVLRISTSHLEHADQSRAYLPSDKGESESNSDKRQRVE